MQDGCFVAVFGTGIPNETTPDNISFRPLEFKVLPFADIEKAIDYMPIRQASDALRP
jgi:hypothetical protein